MEVTREMIAHVAELARLNLTNEEIEKFTPQLKEVIEAFSQLVAENTTGVKPSFHPIEIRNALREDSVKECITQEQALRNAKHKKDGYFQGPKAV
ncbi:MAG: Asp-tRNA(Asn)/Glu-tRNA(Gln) amidotransferase subunit GatC [Nanoarchaeota archaeon]|nr:Asp-tRNA(Asn)/Glu-tRNA(Gln) amidotransferase subunit GatC [Nanoarchaeota archaeon]